MSYLLLTIYSYLLFPTNFVIDIIEKVVKIHNIFLNCRQTIKSKKNCTQKCSKEMLFDAIHHCTRITKVPYTMFMQKQETRSTRDLVDLARMYLL